MTIICGERAVHNSSLYTFRSPKCQ